MAFVLYQYDMAAKAWHQSPDEVTLAACYQNSDLAALRRGIKFLAERTAMKNSLPEFAPAGPPSLFRYVHEAIFFAQTLAELYMASDRAYYILPDEMELELFKNDVLVDGSPFPIIYRLVADKAYDGIDLAFNVSTAKDRTNRPKYFPDNSLNFNWKAQSSVLDSAFEKCFGSPFSKFLMAIALINENAKPDPGSYPVSFFSRRALVADIVRNNISSKESANIILNGFTITRHQMAEEKRAIFKPKQEHRAFRRGYFEFPHRTGPHLIWSSSLASECFDQLMNGVCFKKLPEEWLTSDTHAALETMSNVAGKWFEKAVIEQLTKLGIKGVGFNKSIVGNGAKIDIPSDVGELDFLGYSRTDSALVVVECKMVEVGFEPRLFRDEISRFVKEKDCHAEQLRRKLRWVAENRSQIANALGAQSQSLQVLPCLLTLYPTYASFRLKDLPCASLVEFMEDYTGKGSWPYEIRSK
jgi:hypothetical protein